MAKEISEWVGQYFDFLDDRLPPPVKPKIICALDIRDEIPSKKPLRAYFWKEGQTLKAEVATIKDGKWVAHSSFIFEHGRVTCLNGNCPLYHLAVDEICGFDSTKKFLDLLLRLAPAHESNVVGI